MESVVIVQCCVHFVTQNGGERVKNNGDSIADRVV